MLTASGAKSQNKKKWVHIRVPKSKSHDWNLTYFFFCKILFVKFFFIFVCDLFLDTRLWSNCALPFFFRESFFTFYTTWLTPRVAKKNPIFFFKNFFHLKIRGFYGGATRYKIFLFPLYLINNINTNIIGCRFWTIKGFF